MMRIIGLILAFAIGQNIIAQTPDELKSKLPQIFGWNLDTKVETFNPDNLYERINGAAEGFLMYNFREMIVFVYNKTNGGEDEYITIQAYVHATPDDAFGVYAAERPTDTNFNDIGAEGYQEGSMLNFFVDRMYVKIESPSSSDDVVKAIEQIARKFGDNVNPDAGYPVGLQHLPETNKISHTEQYIPRGFLGHEFLNRAFVATYQVSGKKYQVFIINAGSIADAFETVTKYYSFTKQAGKIQEGRLTFKDRYNGNLECQWKGQYLWGIVNTGGASIKIDNILKETGKNQ